MISPPGDPSPELLASWAAYERTDGTPFQRCMRLLQSVWREASGLPVGEHRGRPAGARMRLPDAEEQGWNFLSPVILEQVHLRLAQPQPYEMIQRPRLWGNLLSSQPMCFNLFGELATDLELATEVARQLWPDVVDTVSEITFEWSPGRTDSRYLGDRTAFDAVIFHTTPDGGRGFIGIETKYHEDGRGRGAGRTKPRYLEVSEGSKAFVDDWQERVLGSRLEQVWRDHLLALAILQADDRWSTGRFVVAFPEENTHFVDLSSQYGEVLADRATFEHLSIRRVVEAVDTASKTGWAGAFRRRYLDFSALADLSPGPFRSG